MNTLNSYLNRFLKAILVTFSCTSNKRMVDPEPKNVTDPNETASLLTYRYEDASLPPHFHRSYTIDVTPRSVYFTIDSYGQVLSKKSLSITKATYQSFVLSMLALNIQPRKELRSDGCTGGTSDKLEIYLGKDYAVKGYVYYCAGQQFGNLEGEVQKAVELFKALVPSHLYKIRS